MVGGGTAQFCKAAEYGKMQPLLTIGYISRCISLCGSCIWIRVAFTYLNGYILWILLDGEIIMMRDIGIQQHWTGSSSPQLTVRFGDCTDGGGIRGNNERGAFRAGLGDLECLAASLRDTLCCNHAKSAQSIVGSGAGGRDSPARMAADSGKRVVWNYHNCTSRHTS